MALTIHRRSVFAILDSSFSALWLILTDQVVPYHLNPVQNRNGTLHCTYPAEIPTESHLMRLRFTGSLVRRYACRTMRKNILRV